MILSCCRGRYGDAIGAGLIFVLTWCGMLTWHGLDQRLPQDDCANLACTSAEIYQTWEKRGFLAGAKELYRHSGWRPILLPNATAPLVFIFRGDAARAASAALVLVWTALYGFTYLCFRRYLGRALSAVCASFLTTLPPYFHYSCVYYAELPMLACLAAGLYYAERFHAGKCLPLGPGVGLGLGLALAMTLRPLEPIPAAGLIFLALAWTGLRHKTLRWSDLLLALAAAAAVAAFLLLRIKSAPFAWRAPLVVAGIVGVYAWIVRRAGGRLNVAFAASVATGLLVVGLWYAPRMHGLAGWVWQCSVGDMVHLYKGIARTSPAAAIMTYLRALGGWQLAGVALLSAAVLPLAYKCRLWAGGFFLALGAAQVALVLLLAMLMEGTDLRRGLCGFYCLFIGLTLLAVAGGGPRLAGLRIVPVAGLALLQAALIWSAATGCPLPSRGQPLYRIVGGPMAARRTEDENREVFRQVQRRVPPGAQIACFSLAVYSFETRAFCPHALNLLAAENAQSTAFGYPWNFQDVSEGYRQLVSGGYNFILLDTRDAPPGLPSEKLQEPTSRLTADLIRRSREKSPAEVGWKQVDQFTNGDATLLILQAVPPGDSLLSAQENLASRQNGAKAWASSSQNGYPAECLNDGLPAAWGSDNSMDDVVACIVLPQATAARVMKLQLFSPAGRAHLNELSVVASNKPPGENAWTILRSRLGPTQPFAAKVSVPLYEDTRCVTLYLDPSDGHAGSYSAYGIACFRKSRGDIPNHLTNGPGVYLREMQIGK